LALAELVLIATTSTGIYKTAQYFGKLRSGLAKA
jgi:hypothetical protein